MIDNADMEGNSSCTRYVECDYKREHAGALVMALHSSLIYIRIYLELRSRLHLCLTLHRNLKNTIIV